MKEDAYKWNSERKQLELYSGNETEQNRRFGLSSMALHVLAMLLMLSGSLIYPFHQNVLWSFLISLGLMWINEKVQAKKKWWPICLRQPELCCLDGSLA